MIYLLFGICLLIVVWLLVKTSKVDEIEDKKDKLPDLSYLHEKLSKAKSFEDLLEIVETNPDHFSKSDVARIKYEIIIRDNYFWDSSYIRRWIKTEVEEKKYSNEVSPKNLFIGIIFMLALFGKDDPNKSLAPLEEYYEGHYKGDASLFEWGCYVYILIDYWLFLHKPHLREVICKTFVSEFNTLFTEALKINNIPGLFTNRVNIYSELIKRKADLNLQQCLNYLSELIYRTKNNTLPKIYNFDNEPINLHVLDMLPVEIMVLCWNKSMILEGIIKSLKEYCNLLERC